MAYINTGFFTIIWKEQKHVYWKLIKLGLVRALGFLLVTKTRVLCLLSTIYKYQS